ncbi:hypothetical protein RUM44_012943 [Polyplax serrata]|uniref:HEAT repeat-containing protein 5B n=1 Tax=Polyplax serrata TaxID=468196 RepID=A0ABR1BGG1_POLSC
MMELSHSLTLNEEALKQIPEAKRPVFVFEWLRFLDKVLIAAQKSDIKECQKKLVDQLTELMEASPGPPTRKLIARCLATLFSVGDTFLLFDSVNKCNDIIKNRDDSPSFLPTRLAAICCVGYMYEKLGRMMGRSYEDTVQILNKALRNAESQTRIEIMLTFEKVCAGMGNAISNVHKDIYKSVRHCMTDRVMAVRSAAAKCLLEMLHHAPFLYTAELENLASLCFRAFDGSKYEVRCSVAKLLGSLVASTQRQFRSTGLCKWFYYLYQPFMAVDSPGNLSGIFGVSVCPNSKLTDYASAVLTKRNVVAIGASSQQTKSNKTMSLEDALGILMAGFLRGGVSFLKGTGEIIKGSSGINREVRVGVTHAYVVFAQMLGNVWVERNLSVFLSHVLDLAANPKAASSHVDAVYSRKCINFILRSVLGRMLGEKAQTSACKEIAQVVAKQMNSIDFNPENAKDCNQETLFSQHLLVCALLEMGNLILGLGTVAQNLVSDASLNLNETICAVLLHPCQAARLAAAWCLRCICIAVPSQSTPLIDRCIESIDNLKSSPEGISGYSAALAAVLGGVRFSPLGVPHTKGKVIFNTGEELLRSASQNSRLSLNKTQAGWLLIGGIMSLGVPVVKGLLPRMLLLWRNSFPRSNKELESEKARGDAFTWQVTLEGRAGALSAMHSFIQNCPELVTDDIIRRILTPIESALAMLTNISTVLKTYGQHLKAPAAMVRLRLYETLSLLPSHCFEGSYTHLLRMLVSEFTLTENPANTTTSLLRGLCHADDSVILGTWLQETDHHTIEDQLQPNSAAGSGALEHDSCCLYRPLKPGETLPGPLPLGVAVIDMSVSLFGQIFPRVANKHRLQVLEHFSECIKHAKAARQEAVQMNLFTALLGGLRGLTETKSSFSQEDVQLAAVSIIISSLTSPNAILRCAAGECLGRMAQVVGDARFTANQAQTSFDRLKSARDVASRTGHSLALGCLHRYVGGMGSSHHLNTSVSILLALAQDSTSPVVQVWSLHALSLIADSGGPMFRGYVEPSLSLILKLLLNVPESFVDVHQSIGKVLSALITAVGPELQGNPTLICTARSSFLCACAIMQDHQDPLVQAEATGCLQQLHLFAPRHVNLSSLVPNLCRTLSSHHLLLRKAAVSCLRQLSQREAKEVCEHALSLRTSDKDTQEGEIFNMTETGLAGVLFSMLDTETDSKLIKDIHDTLTSMLHVLAAENLTLWLTLCKDVLTVATETSVIEDVNVTSAGENLENEGDDDLAEFNANSEASSHSAIQPRWPTRVFAAECVRRLIAACQGDEPAHFDLALAKEMQFSKSRADFLVLHLSDLVRMAFMAATSDSDPLRLEGLKTLQEVIDKFSSVPEPEFPGHLLLEQFQAQVSAALRPAFAPETSSHVSAAACQVCSAWIGSGVARDLNDLKRVHQLLVSSLSKLERKSNTKQLYNESLETLERLAILKAWAEVYVVAMIANQSECDMPGCNKITSISGDENLENKDSKSGNLLSLVQPELTTLAHYWLAALKDHALLSLPPEFSSQLPHDGGAFYATDTIELSRPHYAASWPPILLASSFWLNAGGFDIPRTIETKKNDTLMKDSPQDRFHLLFGICMESLCSPRSCEPTQTVFICLRAVKTLLNTYNPRALLMKEKSLGIELCNVLHRLILTQDNLDIQEAAMNVLCYVIKAAQEKLDAEKLEKSKSIDNSKNDESSDSLALDLLGEGGESGEIIPGKSLVFAVLEVCLCLLVRHLPPLNPTPLVSSPLRSQPLNNNSSKLVGAGLSSMEEVVNLCSPQGALAILPTILYLTTGVIKETATKNVEDKTILASSMPVSSCLHCLKTLTIHRYCKDERSKDLWQKLLQSTLAKLIDLAKTGSENSKMDECTMILGITVLVLHAPGDVVRVPNLLYPCVNHYRQCFQSSNVQVRIKCVETMRRIFLHSDRSVSTPYIHALAPRVIEYLYSEESRQLTSEYQLTLTLESIRTVESLISIAEPKQRIQMLKLLVPILVNCLLEGLDLKEANKYRKTLNEHCLQQLMVIGPQYPDEFKTLISQSADLRKKLESAIRSSQQNQMKTKIESNVVLKTTSSQSPTIKLKTDFSNFSK